MSEFAELVVRGLLLGVTYALLALPISLLFLTTEAVDVAVGGYAVLSAALAMLIPGVSGMAAGVAAAVLASAVVSMIAMRINRPGSVNAITSVLATFGAASFVESFVLTAFGKDAMIRQPFLDYWSIAGMRVSPQAGINIAVGAVMLAATTALLYATPYGRSMRASAVNPIGAMLAGIPVHMVWSSTFLLGGLLAGISGILILYTTGIEFSSGLSLTTTSFGAAILFGLGGPLRAFGGGLTIGVAQALSAGYLPGAWASAAPLLIIFLILASGRLGGRDAPGLRA